MNEFRERLLSGKPMRDPLLRQKAAKRSGGDSSLSAAPGAPGAATDGLLIRREAPRLSDHRDGDRHRLISDEQATATWNGRDFRVQVINLSGGGTMLQAPFTPRLWDQVELSFAGIGRLECAVRWVRGDRIGAEFAHETRIDAAPEVRTAVLREVIRRSFPDAVVEERAAPPTPEASPPAASAEPPSAERQAERQEQRHPLIWTGLVHFNHDSTPVRLRNISAVGALLESGAPFPVGAELLLDLGAAGSVFSTVAWAHGDQSGFRFHEAFDLTRLADTKPEIAPSRWAKPDYLRDDSTESSPWASRWNRLTVGELRQTLSRQT